MLTRLSRFLLGTLRGRLIIAVAAVHAVMMALFVADLTARQSAMLLHRQIGDATALSQSLALSAAGWIVADDVSGLQELVELQRRYPEVLFVMLANKQGRVLADTDTSRLGLYLRDLPREPSPVVLAETPALVDVAVPAMIGERHVGWARVGIGQKAASEKLAAITHNGINYALIAILIGSFVAWFLGRRITRRLYAVQETIDSVRAGNRLARSRLAGDDEAAVMAREFNAMLDDLAQRDAELRASEEKYRVLIEKVQTAIVVHDSQGHILSSNPMAQELLGLSTEQLLGRALIDPGWHFLREDGSVAPVDEYPVAKVLLTRKPLRGQVTGISRPDRQDATWVLVDAEPDHDATGNITRIVVSFVDISERRRAELRLRASEQAFRDVAENSPDVIVRYDREGRRIYVNPEFERFNGLSAREVLGKKPSELSTELAPVVATFTDQLMAAMAAGTITKIDLSWASHGKRMWWYVRVVPEFDANGRVVSALTIWSDITERKQAEEEIRQLNQELEQRVVARTAQLEASVKELEAFSYSVSHDLRAPLRHIDGFVGLLQNRLAATLDEKSRRYMSNISDAARRMSLLIDDLLSFSQMGRSEMAREQVDLGALVQETIRELEPETQGRTIAWRIAALPTVRGDRAMLRIALLNLISNAVKFTGKRAQAEIEIGCKDGREGETIVFVRDNGVGFDMQYVHKLFGVFQRLHPTDEFEGTGIGLANVRRVITRQGGKTWAEGKVDAGATFYFSLPRPDVF